MPTEAEAKDIMEAPVAINDRLEYFLDDNDEINSMNENPAERLFYLKYARSENIFDDIPYGNEFVDKYIAAGERLYPAADIHAAIEGFTEKSALDLVYRAEPDRSLSREAVSEKMISDTKYRYGNLKALRETGAYDGIPGVNEVMDKNLEKLKADHPDLTNSMDMTPYYERYVDLKAEADEIKAAKAEKGMTMEEAPQPFTAKASFEPGLVPR